MASASYYNDSEWSVIGPQGGRKYPNPFFNLANNSIPKDIKSLFKFCTAFYHTDTFLSNIVDKLTRYPITDILFAEEIDSSSQNKVLEVISRIKLRTLLIEIGLDYYVYGNSFTSIFMIPKRYLRNPSDHSQMVPIEDAQYEFKNWKFLVTNPQTGNKEEWEIYDMEVKSLDNLKVTRWNPENIDIDHNPITGDVDYFYSIPNNIKTKIKVGDAHILKNIPRIFIDAVKENKRIKVEQKNFFHFKRPTVAEESMGWGKPIILPAMKKIYYLQTLQRGNEAIAHEHIVPKKAISPMQGGVLDPFATLNMGKWTQKIEEQIKRWRVDPNHIGVFPIPMQYQEIGGNARSLLLTQEMEFLEEVVINSLGIPVEFIKGGASWSGSSVSLRMIENLFVPYRLAMEEFMNEFLFKRMHALLDIPKVKLKFQKLKMADDAQAKQLMLQLSQANKISDSRLLDEFGFNWNEEKAAMEQMYEDNFELQRKQQIGQARIQGETQVILGKYNVKAQKEAQWEDLRLELEKLSLEIQSNTGHSTTEPLQAVEELAMRIAFNNDVTLHDNLIRKSPVLAAVVMQRVQTLLNTQPAAPDGSKDKVKKEGSNARKDPGTRKGDQVEIPEKEKTRANSRGAEPRD